MHFECKHIQYDSENDEGSSDSFSSNFCYYKIRLNFRNLLGLQNPTKPQNQLDLVQNTFYSLSAIFWETCLNPQNQFDLWLKNVPLQHTTLGPSHLLPSVLSFIHPSPKASSFLSLSLSLPHSLRLLATLSSTPLNRPATTAVTWLKFPIPSLLLLLLQKQNWQMGDNADPFRGTRSLKPLRGSSGGESTFWYYLGSEAYTHLPHTKCLCPSLV